MSSPLTNRLVKNATADSAVVSRNQRPTLENKGMQQCDRWQLRSSQCKRGGRVSVSSRFDVSAHTHARRQAGRAQGKVRRYTQKPREGYCVTQDLREEATSLQLSPEAAQTWGSDTQGDTFHRTGRPSTDKVILKLSPPICVSSDSADTHAHAHTHRRTHAHTHTGWQLAWQQTLPSLCFCVIFQHSCRSRLEQCDLWSAAAAAAAPR